MPTKGDLNCVTEWTVSNVFVYLLSSAERKKNGHKKFNFLKHRLLYKNQCTDYARNGSTIGNKIYLILSYISMSCHALNLCLYSC